MVWHIGRPRQSRKTPPSEQAFALWLKPDMLCRAWQGRIDHAWSIACTHGSNGGPDGRQHEHGPIATRPCPGPGFQRLSGLAAWHGRRLWPGRHGPADGGAGRPATAAGGHQGCRLVTRGQGGLAGGSIGDGSRRIHAEGDAAMGARSGLLSGTLAAPGLHAAAQCQPRWPRAGDPDATASRALHAGRDGGRSCRSGDPLAGPVRRGGRWLSAARRAAGRRDRLVSRSARPGGARAAGTGARYRSGHRGAHRLSRLAEIGAGRRDGAGRRRQGAARLVSAPRPANAL